MLRIEKAEVLVLVDDYSGPATRPLLAEHGFAALVTTTSSNGARHSVLLDTGYSGTVLLHNAKHLGVDLERVSAAVLSHGHADHTGGLAKVLEAVGKPLPVVAHPDVEKPLVRIRGATVRLDVGMPKKLAQLELQGLCKPLLTKGALQVAPGVYFLGEVRRAFPDLESPAEGDYAVEAEGPKPHKFLDDTALAVDLGDSLAVVVGCGHSGVVNIVSHAERELGKRVSTVVGGLHMLGQPPEFVEKVVKKLEELGVERAFPGHCTGLRAEYVLLERMKKGSAKLHVGFSVELL